MGTISATVCAQCCNGDERKRYGTTVLKGVATESTHNSGYSDTWKDWPGTNDDDEERIFRKGGTLTLKSANNNISYESHTPNSHNRGIMSMTYSSHRSRQSTIWVTSRTDWFLDHYDLDSKPLSQGQFGITYLCTPKNRIAIKSKYAVKQISKSMFYFNTDAIGRKDILESMKNEINILAKMEHKNIVKLWETYEDRQYIYMVMDYLSGGELFDYIIKRGYLDETQTAKITRSVLEALKYMNKMDVCHLDLKPANIMFEDSNPKSNIKIIDFGMSQIIPRTTKLHKKCIGTPHYIAPEVLDGKISRMADVWSLGVIVFVMLFGYAPFDVDQTNCIVTGIKYNEMIYDNIRMGFSNETKDGFGSWFPKSIPVSKECRNFISGMLKTSVKRRKSVTELLSHPWLMGKCNYIKSIPNTVFDSFKQFNKTNKFKILISGLFVKEYIDPQRYFDTINIFKKFDTNNDGQITLNEFIIGMKSMTKLNVSEIEAIFNDLDKNDDLTITFDELLLSSALSALLNVDERLMDAFTKLDTNDDGIIDINEIKDAIKQQKYNIDENDLKEILDEVDINNDGKIDYQEFLRALHPQYNQLTNVDYDKIRRSTNFAHGTTNSIDQFKKQFNTFLDREFSKNKERLIRAHIRPSLLKKQFHKHVGMTNLLNIEEAISEDIDMDDVKENNDITDDDSINDNNNISNDKYNNDSNKIIQGRVVIDQLMG